MQINAIIIVVIIARGKRKQLSRTLINEKKGEKNIKNNYYYKKYSLVIIY
jgi:hypothetical protein